MSMFNDIDWTQRGKSEKCISNSEQVKNCAKRFSRGHWTFPGPGDEKKWDGTLSFTPEGKWDPIAAEMMVGRFKETGHPAFNLQRYHILQCGFSEHRTLVSHNSLSKSAQYLRSSFKLVCRVRSTDSESKKKVDFGKKLVAKENDQLLVNVKPQEVNSFVQTPRSDNGAPGNRSRECLQRFETLEKSNLRECGDATFARRVSIGLSYKLFLT